MIIAFVTTYERNTQRRNNRTEATYSRDRKHYQSVIYSIGTELGFGGFGGMEKYGFHDGNIFNLVENRCLDLRPDMNHSLQMHSSLIRRLAQERELEGHEGCVNSIAWNSKGSLLISGSDDTRINIWSYSSRKLLHSIDSGHTANIFCTKFVPETSDDLVVSGAGDAEVRLFNLSHLSGRGPDNNAIAPLALYRCHNKRVKKLAVEVGNPNVVWSASEDGTLRQHDFREATSCPQAGSCPQECRNVLLDLRFGAKKSLAEPPKQMLSLKSCDISTTRPHLLLVGGSDGFARLYDRRMLPPLSSCQKRMPPPSCVNYFCPMHLSERGRSTLHLTHVTFSPSGDEVLLSYSGEHVYLMNANHGMILQLVNPTPQVKKSIQSFNGYAMQYASGDYSKLMTFYPTLNGQELQQPISYAFKNGFQEPSTVEKCRKLVQLAQKSLDEGNYYLGIETCNELLDGHGGDVGPTLRHECLCTRAALYLKRKCKNDVHMAIRDCYNARTIESSSFKALHLMSEALSQLGKHKEALEFAIAAQCRAPSNIELAEQVENLRKNLEAAEAEKSSKGSDEASRPEPRSGRALSRSDLLYRSEANSDNSQDSSRSEREDSDYDEEVELDFETSVSGDEVHDVEPNIVHGSLNLRIHRRAGSFRDRNRANGSCGSPSSSQNDQTPHQIETVIDMKQRYVGHCNVGTDIKQASFLGQKGEYIASGSDDGRWYIWEKQTGRLIKMLSGDEAVVNCVQCHPFDCVVATSGIDNTIKIWTPNASVPSIVAGGAVGPETSDVLQAIGSNQHRLSHNREVVLPFELLERFRMHEFSEGTLHPFECAQS